MQICMTTMVWGRFYTGYADTVVHFAKGAKNRPEGNRDDGNEGQGRDVAGEKLAEQDLGHGLRHHHHFHEARKEKLVRRVVRGAGYDVEQAEREYLGFEIVRRN